MSKERKEFTRINPQSKRTKALQAKFISDLKLGLNDEEIANKHGYSVARVKELLKLKR